MACIGDSDIYTLVENVRSLHNVGSIFRTADGAGISKLYLTGITGRPPHRGLRKVALGAEEHVPWEYAPTSTEVIDRLKEQQVQIVALEVTEKSEPYDRVDYRLPLCIVVGHEHHGVSEEVLKLADRIVGIPMCGIKISLNVAVAYGIAVYEILKIKRNSERA